MRRLLCVAPEVKERIGSVYKERCRERIGMQGDALALAMRVAYCATEGLDASVDAQKLKEMQDVDGGWKGGWFFRYPNKGFLVANDGFTTAVAVDALKRVRTKEG